MVHFGAFPREQRAEIEREREREREREAETEMTICSSLCQVMPLSEPSWKFEPEKQIGHPVFFCKAWKKAWFSESCSLMDKVAGP